jgi:hypothetical protein
MIMVKGLSQLQLNKFSLASANATRPDIGTLMLTNLIID